MLKMVKISIMQVKGHQNQYVLKLSVEIVYLEDLVYLDHINIILHI